MSAQHPAHMRFSQFTALYFEDIRHRLRPSTVRSKRYVVSEKILPFFGDFFLDEIRPSDIRQWQNFLLAAAKSDGSAYADTYLKTIHNQLHAIFHYAEKYYDLTDNPCRRVDAIGSGNAKEMRFWTLEEFRRFHALLPPEAPTTLAFETLYFTGIRVGELLALTPCDLDTEHGALHITKSCQRSRKGDIITPPKTPKGRRTVYLPPFLLEHLQTLLPERPQASSSEQPQPAPLFAFHKYHLTRIMDRTCADHGLKRIRLHDLRHSHASLLIELGCEPLLIAQRLGHEKVSTTLNIYGHLYPDKQKKIAAQLGALEGFGNGDTRK